MSGTVQIIEPSWLRTTPPPARDVTALFPGIERYAVTATRLHPRPGAPLPGTSHVGGPLRWPADEPWPACVAVHLVPVEVAIPEALLARLKVAVPARDWPAYQAAMAELASQIPGFSGVNHRTGSALGRTTRSAPQPSPLVAVAQLRAADVPDLCPPPDTDLLQVLWCPNEHEDGGPAVTLRWRREGDPLSLLDRPPVPVVSRDPYLPRACVLHPERVVEYPWWQDLPPELAFAVRAWDSKHHGRYHRQLSMAPGWKVGGWSPWPTTDPIPLYCALCGARMRQLLQIDSGEWGDAQRWRPLEERHLSPGTAEYVAAAEPTGVVAGHSGLYRVFHCPDCPDAPIRVDLQ
jgi:hypothetical protein